MPAVGAGPAAVSCSALSRSRRLPFRLRRGRPAGPAPSRLQGIRSPRETPLRVYQPPAGKSTVSAPAAVAAGPATGYNPAVIALVNVNGMMPPIGPVGLGYVAGAARSAGVDVRLVDLGLAADPHAALEDRLADCGPSLVGLTFRNVDDCFWPSAEWFVPDLVETVRRLRGLTDAPIVLGGVGYSIFPREILQATGADFGIRGDGEEALVALARELESGRRRFDRVPGLLWREGGRLRACPPAWPSPLRLPTARDALDNAAYFRRGGQAGVETKRGCPRTCTYCADPLAKGRSARVRDPREVAEEFESLARQGCDVVHLCDSEFNLPPDHARVVCDELARRRLGDRVRWYTYMAVVPFDARLADRMQRAGCVGINFTGDSAAEAMLRAYRQPHRAGDLASAVRLCRERGIAVMIDLLLGGPGETPETLAETIGFMKRIGPDCVGAALGLRLYPGTEATREVAAEGPLEANPGLKRRYDGPVDLARPTFYISPALGERPARLVKDLIGGDERFFEPIERTSDAESSDHNYNDNADLVAAIAGGARGAYWHILRRLRTGNT